MRRQSEGSGQVFLPSQLVEISQRFQADIEDLQVLLQEEGLPVGSAECLQELSARLATDPRFRRDVAFLMRSMLGRDRDEAGSMDVLGILVVAAEGTRQEFETPSRQEAVRELLRFVIQQRRPEVARATTPASPPIERPAAAPTPIPPPVATRPERPSPAPSVVEAPVRRPMRRVPIEPNPVPVPSLLGTEPEPLERRPHIGRIAAALLVLVALAAGLVIWYGGSKTTHREPAVATAPSAASPTSPAATQSEVPSEPQVGAIPRSAQSTHHSRKPSPRTRAVRQHAEPPQASAPTTVATNTPPKPLPSPVPLQPGPRLNQPLSSTAAQPPVPHHESAAVSPLPNPVRQRSTPGSTDVSKVFAHPDAAATAATQVPPPAFHPKDPVLIARNKPPAGLGQSQIQGTVHTGSTGTMASRLMYSPEPEYPARAIAAGVAGQVTVEAIVGPRGNVVDARVVSGPPLLRDAALDAIGRWRYRPYEEDGKPLSIATTAIFDFQIPPKK